MPLLEKSSQRTDKLPCVGAPNRLVRRPKTYEELLTCSSQASIFAHRWWLDAVAPGNYDILELVHNDELQAAWPIVYLKRDAVRHVYMPPFTQKLGILFAPATARTP